MDLLRLKFSPMVGLMDDLASGGGGLGLSSAGLRQGFEVGYESSGLLRNAMGGGELMSWKVYTSPELRRPEALVRLKKPRLPWPSSAQVPPPLNVEVEYEDRTENHTASASHAAEFQSLRGRLASLDGGAHTFQAEYSRREVVPTAADAVVFAAVLVLVVVLVVLVLLGSEEVPFEPPALSLIRLLRFAIFIVLLARLFLVLVVLLFLLLVLFLFLVFFPLLVRIVLVHSVAESGVPGDRVRGVPTVLGERVPAAPEHQGVALLPLAQGHALPQPGARAAGGDGRLCGHR